MPKRRFIWDIRISYFGYQKQQFRISENKHLFRISKKVILDIHNNYLDIRNQSVSFLDIQNNDTSICDIKNTNIRNNYFGYP